MPTVLVVLFVKSLVHYFVAGSLLRQNATVFCWKPVRTLIQDTLLPLPHPLSLLSSSLFPCNTYPLFLRIISCMIHPTPFVASYPLIHPLHCPFCLLHLSFQFPPTPCVLSPSYTSHSSLFNHPSSYLFPATYPTVILDCWRRPPLALSVPDISLANKTKSKIIIA